MNSITQSKYIKEWCLIIADDEGKLTCIQYLRSIRSQILENCESKQKHCFNSVGIISLIFQRGSRKNLQI